MSVQFVALILGGKWVERYIVPIGHRLSVPEIIPKAYRDFLIIRQS